MSDPTRLKNLRAELKRAQKQSEKATLERPILFSAPMVRAILEGRKTQTRRICKWPITSNGLGYSREVGDILCQNDFLPPSAMLMRVTRGHQSYTVSNHEQWETECPYGKPGDKLWVRETWACADDFEDMPKHCEYFYRAAGEVRGVDRWRPSIFMPRDVSRIMLEITDVRVQRLQDISEEDARAEGIRVLPLQDENDPSAWWESAPGENQGRSARASFAKLWDSINGSGAWDANPFCWAISFRRVVP